MASDHDPLTALTGSTGSGTIASVVPEAQPPQSVSPHVSADGSQWWDGTRWHPVAPRPVGTSPVTPAGQSRTRRSSAPVVWLAGITVLGVLICIVSLQSFALISLLFGMILALGGVIGIMFLAVVWTAREKRQSSSRPSIGAMGAPQRSTVRMCERCGRAPRPVGLQCPSCGYHMLH